MKSLPLKTSLFPMAPRKAGTFCAIHSSWEKAGLTLPGEVSTASGVRIILPQTKDQPAERHAERGVDRLRLRCRIVSQDLDRDIGVADGNNTRLLHAQDPHVNLTPSKAARRVDDCIALEAVGK